MLPEYKIHQMVQSAWMSLFNTGLQHANGTPKATEDADFITACVDITGATQGHVILSCDARLASEMAAAIFAVDPGAVSEEQVNDVLREAVNMIGGQIKTLLPGPCKLSLPQVSKKPNHDNMTSRVLSQLAFECQRQPLQVMLLEVER
jgi:chemotaxis protein CheX